MADGKTVMGERKKTIKTTLLLITILPCLVVCVVLTYLGSSSIKRNMQSATIDGLKYTAVALNAAMHAVNQEDFVLSEDNHLLKGALDLSANPEFIDSFVEGTNAQVTIFYGNTRYATSIIDEKGERMVGTTCSDEIFDTVVNKGQEFKTNSAVFAGQTYYAYYMPLRNADGTPVGIVFAGCPTEKADEVSMSAVATLAGVSFIAQIICVIAGILSAVKIAKGIRESAGYLESVANGDLNIEVSDTLLSRKDEFGQMGADFVLLSDNLKKIMGTIQSSAQSVLTSGDQLKSMATQTSSTADEISHAVDDIAKGAISQAEDVECATVKVNEMGEMIEEIVRQIEALDETSAVMKEAGDASAA
ncbi:MAG: methyl-accepting chemotaxis protein, partial [Pseudobutyrivibrio sp.]|nr:methyl-accepting chemotaxis protein [Pseudobutyrivibrio sp.]